MAKEKLLDNLNTEQIKSVTHKSGPLLIIAGAGTGKTTVITHRIAWLIKEKLARPEEILALTFTEKAAAEMEERVDVLVPYGYIDTWISTFHAFGDRILRENYLELGISGSYEILTKNEQMVWLKNHLFNFPLQYFRPLSNPTKHIEDLSGFVSRCKDENISPVDFEKYVTELSRKTKTKGEIPTSANTESGSRPESVGKQFELSQFYKFYQELLIQEGKFDFGDLIIKTIELFKSHPQVLKKYQEKFKYILVDEFQDTNYAQNELVKLLVNKDQNITVVGDDDQSIYKFRGAAISNILDFKKTFNTAKLIVLKENYRSSKQILDSSYKLIKNNNPDRLEVQNKIDKKLISNRSGIAPQIIYAESANEEIKSVIDLIKSEHKSEKIPYSQMAILARANDHLEPFIQQLSIEKIPYLFSGNRGLMEYTEIKLLTSFIKAVSDPLDQLSHYLLLSSEIYFVDLWQLNKINSWIKKHNKRFVTVLEKIDLIASDIDLDNQTIEKVKTYLDDLKKYTIDSTNRTGGQLLYQFLTDKKYIYNLVKNESIINEIKIRNIAKFFQKIRSLEKYNADKSVHALNSNLEDLENYLYEKANNDNDSEFDAVNILTVHSAKGLEFDLVFMVNLVQDRFPSRKQKEPIELPQILIKEHLPEGDFHLQEERRLFYVGMTRARNELYFCLAQDYGGFRKKKPSLFLAETIELSSSQLKPKITNLITQIEAFKLPFEEKQIKLKVNSMLRSGKLLINPHKIDDYLTCPLKFKYIHILEIPVVKFHHVVYGRAMHEAIRFYFDNKLSERSVELNEMLKVFKNNWDSEGFLDRDHEEKRFKQGIESLTRFYYHQEKLKELPSYVEKDFIFEFDNVLIKGRFDVIYEKTEKHKNIETEKFVEISDFKTSEINDQEKANQRAKDSNQLAVYALAWKTLEKKLPNIVSLNFIDSNLVGKYEVEAKRVEKIKADILQVKEGIIKTDFSAKPTYNNCHYCAYKLICPYKCKGV